jgi:AcrR family transcriptional regulator
MTNAVKKGSPRERLLQAADELFYENGVHSVGVDRVIARAGVAKASLYTAFGSKDELVRTYLTERHAKWRERVDTQLLQRFTTPRERLLGVFDILGELIEEPNFRGCAFNNANAEAAPGGAVSQAIEDFREWIHALFAGLCKEAGAKDPEALTQQLVLLYDGASIKGHIDHDPAAAKTARAMAAVMVEAALREHRLTVPKIRRR